MESQNPLLTTSTAYSIDRFSQLPVIGWFFRKGFRQGAFWATMIALFSLFNDILMRYLGDTLPCMEIIFFRFLFGTLTILPFMIYRGKNFFKTNKPVYHVLRAFFGVGAFFANCYGVNVMPLNENTIIMSSQPLFFLPLALVFLHEKVGSARWLATFIGFLGVLIIMQPGMETFMVVALVPTAAALQFAILDILAKKMVATENTYNMLFYFSSGTTVLSLIPTLYFWETPSMWDLGLLLLLGIVANLVQVSLIRAFSATDASALMPFRYLEFFFALIFGFILFAEFPTVIVLLGSALIILGTFYVSYAETTDKGK